MKSVLSKFKIWVQGLRLSGVAAGFFFNLLPLLWYFLFPGFYLLFDFFFLLLSDCPQALHDRSVVVSGFVFSWVSSFPLWQCLLFSSNPPPLPYHPVQIIDNSRNSLQNQLFDLSARRNNCCVFFAFLCFCYNFKAITLFCDLRIFDWTFF